MESLKNLETVYIYIYICRASSKISSKFCVSKNNETQINL